MNGVAAVWHINYDGWLAIITISTYQAVEDGCYVQLYIYDYLEGKQNSIFKNNSDGDGSGAYYTSHSIHNKQ